MGKLKMVLVWYLAGAMLIIGITPRCFAGFSPSGTVSLSPAEKSADLQRLQKFLEAKMVRERLKELGFTPEEVQMKMSGFSDSQIRQMAIHLDEMTAAGDGAGLFIVVFLIALLIVLIIYASGHKIVLK